MAEAVSSFLGHYFSPPVIVFIVSMLPILELRGGLVVAKLMGVPWLQAYIISIIGNLLPIPFIIILIKKVLVFLQNHGPIKKFALMIEEKGKKGGQALQKKHPNSLMIGLFLFVAIPFPGTGAWTGALIAAFLDMENKKAFLAIVLGIIGASIIVSLLAYMLPGMFGL